MTDRISISEQGGNIALERRFLGVAEVCVACNDGYGRGKQTYLAVLIHFVISGWLLKQIQNTRLIRF